MDALLEKVWEIISEIISPKQLLAIIILLLVIVFDYQHSILTVIGNVLYDNRVYLLILLIIIFGLMLLIKKSDTIGKKEYEDRKYRDDKYIVKNIDLEVIVNSYQRRCRWNMAPKREIMIKNNREDELLFLRGSLRFYSGDICIEMIDIAIENIRNGTGIRVNDVEDVRLFEKWNYCELYVKQIKWNNKEESDLRIEGKRRYFITDYKIYDENKIDYNWLKEGINHIILFIKYQFKLRKIYVNNKKRVICDIIKNIFCMIMTIIFILVISIVTISYICKVLFIIIEIVKIHYDVMGKIIRNLFN